MSRNGDPIALEAGWGRLNTEGIERLERLLDTGFDTKSIPFKQAETMALYHVVYTMSTQKAPHNWSEQLYTRHNEAIKGYLRRTVLPNLRMKRGPFLLQELVLRWDLHRIMNRWMYKIFQYLDRYYVEHHNLPTLQEAGMRAFYNVVFEAIKGELTRAVTELIDRERDGEGVDRSLLKKCIEVYVAMGGGVPGHTEVQLDVYTDEFQLPLLATTSEHYRRKAESWMLTDDVPTYLCKAEAALTAERDRVQSYMNPATESVLLRVVEKALLQDQQSKLLDNEATGLRAMLRDDRREDLGRVYRLFERVEGGLPPVAAVVREHFHTIGSEIVAQREAAASGAGKTAAALAGAGGPSASAGGAASGAGASAVEKPAAAAPAKEDPADPAFVQALLDLHERAKSVVNKEFMGNNAFQKALKDAFEMFVNKDTPGSKFSNAEMVATYVDRLLKQGGEKLSDEQVEEALERVVQLFSYIADKDVFGEIYRGQLSKRILAGRSVSNDVERSMILKLKLRCGAQYTSKMEGMLNDLATAETQAAEFRAHLAAKRVALPRGMEFSVQVLTTGFWPSFPKVELRLPADFTACTEVFAAYYATKTQHRRLQWVHALGGATVKGNYGKDASGRDSVFEFQLTTLQAVALTHFNERDALTLDEMREALGSDVEVVKRVLHSLSCGKSKLLLKTPEGNTIGSSDSFRFNAKFTSPLRRLRIPMASLEDSNVSKRNVEEDRSLAVEAALVRIMKARKTLTHSQLASECVAQLPFFRPQPKEIKKRIEHLISREYLERDDADPNTYRYLA